MNMKIMTLLELEVLLQKRYLEADIMSWQIYIGFLLNFFSEGWLCIILISYYASQR